MTLGGLTILGLLVVGMIFLKLEIEHLKNKEYDEKVDKANSKKRTDD